MPTPKEIENNMKFSPFFKDILEAIDRTHILVCPLASDCACYCDYKGQTSQNVLAICTLDLKFCHILAE
jgi:hypothetical protein